MQTSPRILTRMVEEEIGVGNGTRERAPLQGERTRRPWCVHSGDPVLT